MTPSATASYVTVDVHIIELLCTFPSEVHLIEFACRNSRVKRRRTFPRGRWLPQPCLHRPWDSVMNSQAHCTASASGNCRAGQLCWNKSPLPSYHLSSLMVNLLFRYDTVLSSKQSYCQPDLATIDDIGNMQLPNLDQTSDP